MKPTLLACFVVAMFGYSRTIAAASGDVLERRKAVMAAHPDGRFLLAFEDELPRIKAAVDDVIKCERAGRAGCMEVAQDALSVAQAAVTFASKAEVSSRVEPVRIMAEAGFRAAALALSNMMRFHQTGRREALSRAELEVSEAEELLLGAAALAQGVGEAQASGEAPRELPPRAQVQRDVDGFIASQKAQGVRVENVFITSIAPDKLEKDLAHAEARGELGGDSETNRWRLVLSYRKVQDSWKLERLAPKSEGASGRFSVAVESGNLDRREGTSRFVAPSPEDVMATTRGRRTLLAAATITALTLFTLPMRNESFECCTTRAYGFPLPWWVESGECGRGASWPEQLLYWAGNSLLGLVVAATVTAVWRAVKEDRAAEADAPRGDRE